MTYFTIAKGYSPGSFNTYATDAQMQSYGSEKLISYELGTKSSFLDNKIMTNAALYYMDIKNLHTVQYTNIIDFYISNDAKATSKGFELEIKTKATKNLSLFANYGYNDITFDSFKNAKGDYKGNTKPFAPKHTYNLSAIYRNEDGCFESSNISIY